MGRINWGMRSGINYYGHRVDVLAPYDSYLKSNEPIRTPLIIILSKKIMVGLLSRIIIIHGKWTVCQRCTLIFYVVFF